MMKRNKIEHNPKDNYTNTGKDGDINGNCKGAIFNKQSCI